jgi:hypothetical protein
MYCRLFPVVRAWLRIQIAALIFWRDSRRGWSKADIFMVLYASHSQTFMPHFRLMDTFHIIGSKER